MKLLGKSRPHRRLIVVLLCLSFFSFTLYASSCFASQSHLTESEPSASHQHHASINIDDSHHPDSGHRHDDVTHTCICKYSDLHNSSASRSTPPVVTTAIASIPLPAPRETHFITTTIHTQRHTRAPPII